MREFHPVANIFPLMEGQAFRELVDDIRQHGLHQPIVLHPDGRIVDGRNRYRACIEAGFDPACKTWDESVDGELVPFVLSLNLRRRHLDEAQRAIVAGKIATLTNGGDRRSDQCLNSGTDVTQPEAAAMLNVSRDSVQKARRVIDKGTTELVQAVERGDMSLREAAEIATVEPEQQAEIIAKPKPERHRAVEQIRQVRSEGKLDKSRAAVQERHERLRVMASEGHSSRQIAAAVGMSEEGCRETLRKLGVDVPADRATAGSHKHDANRILEHIVMDAEHLTADVGLIDFKQIDRERLGEWIDSLVKSKKSLGAFINRLAEEHKKHGQAA
jgi:hypothetical protein